MVRQYVTHLPNTCNVVAWLTVPPTLLATHSYVPSCCCVEYEIMSEPLVSTMMPSHCICSSSRISPSLYQFMTAGGLLRMIWQGSSTDIPRLTVACGLLPFVLSRTGFTRHTHTHICINGTEVFLYQGTLSKSWHAHKPSLIQKNAKYKGNQMAVLCALCN